ncbi:hypothetical protein MARI151_60611 [Maribacter litoralis]|uniref:Uncharacterized protein n=1 Tax=Maribacter litoralis TaxID=2059726 RepID=A0A653XJV6_9FLAO|nr:hypothetical protein MARI151_60611 [Maribacter litoralis]
MVIAINFFMMMYLGYAQMLPLNVHEVVKIAKIYIDFIGNKLDFFLLIIKTDLKLAVYKS